MSPEADNDSLPSDRSCAAPSPSRASVYPSCFRNDKVARWVGGTHSDEQFGLPIVSKDLEIDFSSKEVATIETLNSSLSIYFKDEYVSELNRYYMSFGFNSIPEMTNCINCLFAAKGLSLMEVLVYIVDRCFQCHEATYLKPMEAGESKEEGRRGKEQETGGEERNKKSTGGGEGGHRDLSRWQKLNINPIPIKCNRHLTQNDIEGKHDVLSDHLRPTCKFFASKIQERLSETLRDAINLESLSQPAYGLVYHATVKSSIPLFKRRGILPAFFRNYVSPDSAFYVGNLLPEVILYSLMKFPQLQNPRDPVVVLSFKIERKILEDVPGWDDWYVQDFKHYNEEQLAPLVAKNMRAEVAPLSTPERDAEYRLTGDEVEVDLVIAPWIIPGPNTGEYAFGSEWACPGTKSMQFAFTSERSWAHLNAAYSEAFMEDWDQTTIVPKEKVRWLLSA